jgi:hypothetical protein
MRMRASMLFMQPPGGHISFTTKGWCGMTREYGMFSYA